MFRFSDRKVVDTFADRQYARTMWRRICCLSHANGVIVVVSGPFLVSAVALVAFVCRTSVSFSVVSGRVILCGPLESWSADRSFYRGIRLQAAAASCAHGSCSEGREPVARVQMPLIGNWHVFVHKRVRASSNPGPQQLPLPTTAGGDAPATSSRASPTATRRLPATSEMVDV